MLYFIIIILLLLIILYDILTPSRRGSHVWSGYAHTIIQHTNLRPYTYTLSGRTGSALDWHTHGHMFEPQLLKVKVKSSMARSLPVENLLPQKLGSIINYLQ